MNLKSIMPVLGLALLGTIFSSGALAQSSSVCNTVVNADGKTFNGACVPQDVLDDWSVYYTFEDDGGITYTQSSPDLSQGSCWYQEPGTYGIDYLDVWLHGYYTEDLPF